VKIRFLLNPASGRGTGRRYRRRLERRAAKAGADLRLSTSSQNLTDQARRAVDDGVDRLVVAGGDGTMHHAVQALAGSDCALGIIGIGSGNDLASSLAVPRDLESAVERAVRGSLRRIDLGRCRERVFTIYAGAGFDSEVAAVARRVRWPVGPLIYPYAVLRTLAEFRALEMSVEHDSGVFRGRAMLAVISNCPRFGGGMRIAPEAELADGLLDLTIVREVSRLELLQVFPKVYRGTHVTHPALEMVRSQRVVLSLDRQMQMYGDGEPMGTVGGNRAEVEVWPRALAVASGE
jgi:diacylglycerol kinase (ATP)